MKKNNTTKVSRKLTKEQLEKREKSSFKSRIRNTFVGAGFHYIPTNDIEMYVGHRKIEIDALFVYENIWLVCEDTIKTRDIRDHIRTKNEAFGEIKDNLADYQKQLSEKFPDYSELICAYEPDRIKVFGLYFSKYDLELSDDDHELYKHLIFVETPTLNYFNWVVKGIHHSARNEVFRFLGIKASDIGLPKSSGNSNDIVAPIIYPKEFTGLKNKIRVVSFMMSAEDLIGTCYVLRKDNWENSIWLYQRLIDNDRLKRVRSFIETRGEAFFNNIIVALPDEAAFKDASGKFKTIDEISNLEANCQLVLPKELNSICIIDGQHRIFAHYESGIDSKQERTIARLRKQLHLLVTGLVFPKEMSSIERAKIQSKIFDDINSNAKSVPANVLLQIKRISDPISDESIAQFVVEKLNKQGVFKKMLQLSTLDSGTIKTASIVRFALRYLVTITPATEKKSLFDYWDGDKDSIKKADESAIKSYVDYCSSILNQYFSAVKKNFSSEWEDPESKLLTVTSINGFIIALTRQLPINGVQNYEFYNSRFEHWKYDFSKLNFPFASSQYRKFSSEILKNAFGISEELLENI